MHYGVVMFPPDYAIRPDDLARAAEDRGFESFWVPEHTHIPVSRKSPWPGGGPRELGRVHGLVGGENEHSQLHRFPPCAAMVSRGSPQFGTITLERTSAMLDSTCWAAPDDPSVLGSPIRGSQSGKSELLKYTHRQLPVSGW